MKISKILVPVVVLTATIDNSQVEATKAQCIQGCVAAHSVAAKACSAVFWNMPLYIGCQLAASGGLTFCIAGCNADYVR